MSVGQKRCSEIGSANCVGLLKNEAAPGVVPANSHCKRESKQQPKQSEYCTLDATDLSFCARHPLLRIAASLCGNLPQRTPASET